MKVFLSSTFKDLEDYRAAVITRLRRLDGVEVRCMEDFGARPGTPKDFCIEEAQNCDLFIGLIGHLYGFIPAGDDASITEQEYDAASAAERDMLLFVAPIGFKVPVDLILDDTDPRKQKKFRERVLKGSVANVNWSTPEQLAVGVMEAVRNWERARLGGNATSLPLVPGIDLEKYAQRCRKRWEAVDLTALAAPGALDSDVDAPKLSQVFIPQACRRSRPAMSLPRDYLQKQGLDPDEEEQLLSELQARWERQERLPSLDLLARNEARKLVLLGDPGAGKSSLTRFVLLQLLDPLADPGSAHGDWHRALNGHWPVLIELRDLLAREAEGRCGDLLSYLGYVGEMQGFGFDRAAVETQLRDRPSLIIVDGLDEIFDVKRRRGVVEEVIGLETRFPRARVLVTSRIAGFDARPFEAAGYEIATLDDLDQEQIKVFAERWFTLAFPGEPEKAAQARGDLLDTLERRPQLAAIAGNPLILTIMAIIARHKRLARSRAQLYAQALDVLCYAWDYRRGLALSPDSPLADLQPDDTLLMLRRIAWQMQESNEGLRANAISEADLRAIIVDFFGQEWRFPPPRAKRAATEMVDLLQERNWILTTRGPELYGFVHRTFLEYLCALELTKRFEAQELTLDVLRDRHLLPRVDDDSYSEVIRLLCGQLPPRAAEQLIIAVCPADPGWDARATDLRTSSRLALAWQSLGEMEPRALASVESACATVLARLHEWLTKNRFSGLYSEMADGIRSIEPGSWPAGTLRDYSFPFHPTDDTVSRPRVIEALSRAIWLPDPGLRARLFQLSGSDEWYDRRGALIALAVRTDDPAVHDRLCAAARDDKDSPVRTVAVKLLAERFTHHANTFSLVQHVASRDPSGVVRALAVQLLAEWFADRAGAFAWVVSRANQDSDDNVCVAAVNALAGFFGRHTQAFAELLALAEADRPLISAVAVKGLAAAFPDDAGLVTRLGTWAADHHSSEIRAAALEGLAREFADSPGVYELLTRQAAEDPEAGVRATAVALLGEAVRGRPEILDVVGQRALDDPSPEVRKEATLVYAKYLFPSIPSQLLTEDLDGVRPGIDPSEWITRGRVTEVATYLELPEADIRHHYESLIREHQLPLRLEWLGDAAAGEG